ncbi:hypothetical protein [Corallococcus exiguus]|uniref:hypothetical protein n=1 Tax=Corallococcus exiguus TaxID=83462 RepID=UPI001F35FFF5|nr:MULTISPECIES: hypothetical protein [Corallococcus]
MKALAKHEAFEFILRIAPKFKTTTLEPKIAKQQGRQVFAALGRVNVFDASNPATGHCIREIASQTEAMRTTFRLAAFVNRTVEHIPHDVLPTGVTETKVGMGINMHEFERKESLVLAFQLFPAVERGIVVDSIPTGDL